MRLSLLTFLQTSHGLTIHSYGDDKGACEMVFSYGFLDDSLTSARSMFLDLDIPDDDPLKLAKKAVSTVAPGVRIFDHDGVTAWESDFIWLPCINEEDGLEFRLLQTVNGTREIQALWKGEQLNETSKLRGHLEQDPLWDVFQLRATALLQDRVEHQLYSISEMGGSPMTDHVRERTWQLAKRLRLLECKMLNRLRTHLGEQVRRLA